MLKCTEPPSRESVASEQLPFFAILYIITTAAFFVLHKTHRMPKRNTFKYHLKRGRKVVHRGITNDLERREAEHQQRFPGAKIKQVGRRTTRAAALKWERMGGKRPYRK